MRIIKTGVIAILTVLTTQAAMSQDTLLTEDFSTKRLPKGWENINNLDGTSGSLWLFDNPHGKGPATGFATPTADNGYAIFDSDGEGNGSDPHDADLISPSVNLNAYDSTATLVFSHYFNATGDETNPFPATDQVGKVMLNNGSGWEQIAIYEAPANSGNGETVEIDISAQALGNPNVKIKFNWTSGWEQYWMVDDVFIIANKTVNAPPPATPPVAMVDSVSTDTSMEVEMFVLENDSAKDFPIDSSSIEIESSPKFGNATINRDAGTITYSPLEGYEGVDSLSYLVKDTAGNPSNVTKVYITIAPGSTSTGISILKGEKINLYPNPAKDLVNFDLPVSELNKLKTVSIFNYSGSRLFFVKTTENQIKLPSSLNSGIYMVRIESENNTYLGKLIKN